MPVTILWFRQDLRLADNPALQAALLRRGPIVPVYIYAPDEEGAWAPGAASRWWLHQSLLSLDAALREHGSALCLRRGPTVATLQSLLSETGADAVLWNRRYEPAVIAHDQAIKQLLRAAGLLAESHNAALLAEPWQIQNQNGKPFQVYTPYWRSLLRQIKPPAPASAPTKLPAPARFPTGHTVDELELLPRIRWYESLARHWQPGETGAQRQLQRFIDKAWPTYTTQRELPAVAGSSRLSPHLHFGELSPRQVWHAIGAAAAQRGIAATEWQTDKFLTELGWREFAHYLLYHHPQTPTEPLRTAWRDFQWREDAPALRAWQRGRTGVPLIDAGMRELWTTGWMHNRVRMIVASFLVKNLRLPWQAGARWFWDTLVDADLANNTQGWQWTAGCGADAAPYFRIFNPVTQGERFDPRGEYLRRWLPELARLPDRYIHAPWIAPAAVLQAADIALGREYPAPIVDLKASRAGALAAYQRLRADAATGA
jgi:deoxyribodipyrimidine photo-lyase